MSSRPTVPLDSPPGADTATGTMPQNDQLGRIIAGRYRILKPLVAGGMGVVFAVEHLALRKTFAMKMLPREARTDPEQVERFKKEAQSCSRLNHPHCIAVTDSGQTQSGELYLVFELVDGPTLASLIPKDAGLPVARVLPLFRQLLLGLQHAHSLEIVHRDIKPDNLVVLRQAGGEFLKILDFGIAEILQSGGNRLGRAAAQPPQVYGTPEFMAPEQALGEKTDARTDLYAAGIVLYQLLTGKLPFCGENKLAVLSRQVTDSPPALVLEALALSGIPVPQWNEFLQKALRKKKEDRFQSAQEMLQALAAIEALPGISPGAPVTAPPLTKAPHAKWRPVARLLRLRNWREWRNLPAPALYGLLGLLIVGVSLMVWSWGGGDSRPSPGQLRSWPREKPAALAPLEADRLGALEKQISAAPNAQVILDLREFIRDHREIPEGHLLLGLAFSRANRVTEGLLAFQDAIMLNDRYRTDPRLLEELRRLLALPANQDRVLDFIRGYVGIPAAPLLLSRLQAAGGFSFRRRLEDALRQLGRAGEVNWAETWRRDLEAAPSCESRRKVVREIVQRGGAGGVPLLRQELARKDGFLGLSRANACMEKELRAGLKELASDAK